MKRVVLLSGSLVALCLIVVLRADVKTTEKTSAKFEGMLGMIMKFGGGSEPTTSSVALKGNRMSQMNGNTGMIVDLGEQKVYQLDTKKKEYTVMTFAEMKAQMEKAKADAEKQMAQMKPEDKQAMQDAKDATKNIEFDADVKETGQKKNILGYDTHEVILTITMHEKGKKVEDSGGMVMSSDMWLAPRIPALAELGEFYMKFFQTVYGSVFTGGDPRSTAQISAMVPGFAGASEKLAAESKKLQGTAIVTTTKLETIKSAEQMKQAQQAPQQSGGGGLSGALAKRIMGNRGSSANEPRSTIMTTTREYLTIATAASAEDVAIPQGFKEKK
jgi:hypothetical protein